MLLAMPTASDCLVGLLPERYGATVARLRRIFLFFLGWFLMDIKYGATVARLRRIFLRFLGWFLIDMKYGAIVARLHRIFFGFSRARWSGMAPQAGAQEIWCNCGAFAPYFLMLAGSAF